MEKQDVIKGTLRPLILKLIMDNRKMYGYQITQKVKEITDEKLEITEGALYPTLHKLVDEGILTTKLENHGSRMRKYYMLTSSGKKIARERINNLKKSISILIDIFNVNPQHSYGT